jgi:hypothetical protein
MATMTDRQSVGANAVVANAISGKTHEFVTEPSVVSYYGSAAAVALFSTLIIGTEIVVEDQELNAANRMPTIPTDFVAQGGAFPGDRIVVKLRNSTAGAIVGFTLVQLDPA